MATTTPSSMNTFLNQWSMRAICTYARRSSLTERSATVVVEDMSKPFESWERHEAPTGAMRGPDNHGRHPGRCGAGRIGVRAVADIQHVRRVNRQARARGEKPARARLERVDLRNAARQHD